MRTKVISLITARAMRTAGVRRARAVLPALVCLFYSTLTAGAVPGAPVRTGSSFAERSAQAAGACLADDPYNLNRLAEIISSETPPSAMVVINEHLSVAFVGKGKLVDKADDEMPSDPATDGTATPQEPAVEATSYRRVPLRVFNTATLNEFRVSMAEPMLRDIHRCREQAGLTSANGGRDGMGTIEKPHRVYLPIALRGGAPDAAQGAAAPPRPAGWSNGDDSRILLAPTTGWPWRTIAQFAYLPGSSQESRCTATLIGPRHLITAAHCIVNQGTNNWFTWRVTPGRDGVNIRPYGSSIILPDPPPGTAAWYFTPEEWRDPNTQNVWQHDWGMIVIPDRLGDLTGWMGYMARTATSLNQQTHINRGYPRCSSTVEERPHGCNIARLYGDVQACGIGGYYYQWADGWNRVISLSCDISRGHSGSAVYHYYDDPRLGQEVPVVTMMISTQDCFTCAPGINFPNRARRITPEDLGVISGLRESFP